jgi:hypothetical protein
MQNELEAALAAYSEERTAASWTALSQLWVREEMTVFDALKLSYPDFPDPLPLPVEGVLEDSEDFYQWSELPDPDQVLRAILSALNDRGSSE